ncbi:hypothetical protein [Roseateles sp. BYS96W]|uniref:Uncharacterized protein n=1 Tax=Pelomonas nitida TaxID=3299027 RepID=A0ABW7G2N4_9BURK
MNIVALSPSIVRTATSAAPTAGAEGRSAAESAALAAGYEHYQNSSTPVTLTGAALELGDSKVVYEKWNTKTSASLTADESIKTIEARLKKFQSSLAAARPDLAASNWDVTIKEGKLHVVGDVQAADKAAMENILNNDTKLAQAVASYMGAATAYLETTAANSAFVSKNAFTGNSTIYNFKDVSGQLEGNISFKELIATSWKMYKNPNGGPSTNPGQYSGISSLEILASRLTSDPVG